MIELVVVMVIGSVTMAIAILGIQNIVRHYAPDELISELHLARMYAIRQHRPVTVRFLPNTTQCTVSWNLDGGGFGTKRIDLGRQGPSFYFDNNPPGAPPAPDIEFIFSPLGFISTNPGGNATGHIYLTNQANVTSQNNIRYYQIQTTIAGGIDLNRYNPVANTWDRASH